MNTSIFDRFHAIGVIPILEIDSTVRAVPVAEALSAGGLPIAEVTLRTDGLSNRFGISPIIFPMSSSVQEQ